MSKVLVSFILDETGSMDAVVDQTISGFNEYLKTLKQDDRQEDMRFALTKFNSDKVEVVYDGVKLEKVAELNQETYKPAATTPLYDAIGRTIRSVEKQIEGKKRNVLMVIQTDGQENASKEYTQQIIFDLINQKKADGWTFVFMGADQDAWAASGALGIDKGNTMSYASAATVGTFNELAEATTRYNREGGTQTRSFWLEEETSDQN